MAVEYGTIAVVPKGTWDSSIAYEVANLVAHDGSSYLAHTQPPVGTPPTDPAYWQISAAGTGRATTENPGTVKPDGETLIIDNEGTLSAVKATQATLGMVKGSNGVNVAEDGAIGINTAFTRATELADLIAGEAMSQILGKISKSISVTMNLDQNALLKNMLTNIDLNDREKIPTAALVHTLIDRIGMGESLAASGSLTSAVNKINDHVWNIPKTDRIVAAGTSQVAENWICPETGLYLINIAQYVNAAATMGRFDVRFAQLDTGQQIFMACIGGPAAFGGTVFSASRAVGLTKGVRYGLVLNNSTDTEWRVNNDDAASYWNIIRLKQY